MSQTSKLTLLTLLALMGSTLHLACQGGANDIDTPSPATAPALTPVTVKAQTVTDDGTIVATLSNLSTVIIKAAHTNPVVCVRAYVRTGSLYEGPWLGTGISHLTEHLVAEEASHDSGPQQAAQTQKKAIDRVSLIGGQANAYTSLDHTCYYISAAADKVDDCIELVADWMARPKFSPAQFQREHGVVQRELEMGKDNPNRQAYYAHMAQFFATHPASVPVIGYAKPMAALTYKDIVDYHLKKYVPQNMVFCIVGDIDPQAVLGKLCESLAGFEPGRASRQILPEVPTLTGIRRGTYPLEALKDVSQSISFQTIPLLDDDLYALDVLSYVLTRGRASRLVEKIERQQKLVTMISSSSWTPAWGTGAFKISFRSEPELADQAEQAILDELKLIVTEGVSDDQLTRAKRQKIADLVYSQQSVESISAQLATDYLSTNDVGFSKRYTDQIQHVTAEQVHEVATKYFNFDNICITRMVPPGRDAELADKSIQQKAEAQLITLTNGLRVALNPDNSVGLVSFVMVSKGGILAETTDTNGLGNFMTAMTVKGAGNRTAQDIAQFFDQAGGAVAGKMGNNTFYWQGSVLSDSFADALPIFADIIQKPTFDPNELEILRPKLLAAVQRVDENWRSQLRKYFRQTFFIDSPYQMLTIGSQEVLSGATADQLRQFHSKHVLAGSSVLAIFGNFDPVETAEKIQSLFGQMPEGEFSPAKPDQRVVAPDGEMHVLKTANTVSGIIVAAPGMTVINLQDRMPMAVLDTIISGFHFPAGWLHTELRGKQLVYVVHAYNFSGLAPGAFVTYAACQPDRAGQVIDIIKSNLKRASQYEPTEAEISLAVNTILTAELLGTQSMQELAMSAALDELYGFGYDFRKQLAKMYGKITPADVLRVGKKYLSGPYVVSVTTPQPETLDRSQADQDENK